MAPNHEDLKIACLHINRFISIVVIIAKIIEKPSPDSFTVIIEFMKHQSTPYLLLA